MTTGNWIVWGFIATLVLTSLMAAAEHFRLTRMSLPLLLGTMFTANRDSAKATGFLMHVVNGWVFSLVYLVVFETFGTASVVYGAVAGFVHGMIVLSVVVPLLPGVHPRMAGEQQSPIDIRQLEPPGFMGMHYGPRTPVAAIVAHIVYGAILGLAFSLR